VVGCIVPVHAKAALPEGHALGRHRRGVRPFPHPDVMLTYGSKDSLVKVATTDAGLEDTHAYTSVEALQQQV